MNSVQVTPGKAHVIHWGFFFHNTFWHDRYNYSNKTVPETNTAIFPRYTAKLGCMPVFFFFSLLPPLANHVSYCMKQIHTFLYLYTLTICLRKGNILWFLIPSSNTHENSVIIYPASHCSKRVWLSFFCATQQRIFRKMFLTIMKVNGVQNCLKENHTGFQRQEGD